MYMTRNRSYCLFEHYFDNHCPVCHHLLTRIYLTPMANSLLANHTNNYLDYWVNCSSANLCSYLNLPKSWVVCAAIVALNWLNLAMTKAVEVVWAQMCTYYCRLRRIFVLFLQWLPKSMDRVMTEWSQKAMEMTQSICCL